MQRQVALGFLGRPEHTCGTRAQQEDSVGFKPTTSEHFVSGGAGSTTELSPTPNRDRRNKLDCMDRFI